MKLETLDQCVDFLEVGQVILFPTETVYGLLASTQNTQAYDALYALKQRPQHNPLAILAKEVESIEQFALLSEQEKCVLHGLTPGPLTLVLHKRDDCAWVKNINPDMDTIAVRIPNHPTLLALLAQTKGPLIATSANISGHPPAKTLGEGRAYFEDTPYWHEEKDAGGIPSTVARIEDGRVSIIREGELTKEDIQSYL